MGIILSNVLSANAVSAEVQDSLNMAIVAAAGSQDESFRAYGRGMERAASEYGIEGVKMQVMYLLSNGRTWLGAGAPEAKKVLKKWSNSK